MMDIIGWIVMIPLILFFYAFFLFRFFGRYRARNLEKRFFRAVISVLNNNQNEEDCIKQLNLNFKKLSEKVPNLSIDMKSSIDPLEDLIHYQDTLGEKEFKNRFALEITNDARNRVVKLVDKMREQNPFVSLSPKDANLLINLKHAIESGNADLGSTILKQLAEETEVKESNIRVQQKRNNMAYVIAAIGVILTLFFGLLSFTK